MALELRIAGPSLDLTQRIEPGQPPLVIGRDPSCTVCLPDPERSVSRRHLSVWNEADALHFLVLSVVNGVDLPSGEVPPGARGVLAQGQALTLSAYSLTVQAAEMSEPDPDDPWSVFDRDDTGTATIPADLLPSTLPASQAQAMAEADPFGDWGFQTTFGANLPGAGGLYASGLAVAQDLSAFFRGLGLDAAQIGALSQGELEAIGRLVRQALLGLLDLHASALASKQELRAQEGTVLAPKERNPLKEMDWPAETALRYLFGGRATSAAFAPPERAMREVVEDLLAHDKASALATRAALAGVLREFEPEALKTRLLAGAGRLFESARAWDAYTRHYEEQAQDSARWVQLLLDRYFAEAYAEESMRIKRDAGSPQR